MDDFAEKLNATWGIKPIKSSMVSLKPTPESCVQIANYARNIGYPPNKKFNPDTYHITIRYWKHNKHITNEVIRTLEIMKEEIFRPIELKPQKMDIFGDSAERALVMRFSSNEIDIINHYVDKIVTDLGVPLDKFLIFKPHLTIGDGATELPSPPNFNIKFNAIQYLSKDSVIWEHKI